MKTEDLIEALDQRYGNPLSFSNELIREAINQLKFLSEDNKALKEQLDNGY
jgi:hypothetical protein